MGIGLWATSFCPVHIMSLGFPCLSCSLDSRISRNSCTNVPLRWRFRLGWPQEISSPISQLWLQAGSAVKSEQNAPGFVPSGVESLQGWSLCNHTAYSSAYCPQGTEVPPFIQIKALIFYFSFPVSNYTELCHKQKQYEQQLAFPLLLKEMQPSLFLSFLGYAQEVESAFAFSKAHLCLSKFYLEIFSIQTKASRIINSGKLCNC